MGGRLDLMSRIYGYLGLLGSVLYTRVHSVFEECKYACTIDVDIHLLKQILSMIAMFHFYGMRSAVQF